MSTAPPQKLLTTADLLAIPDDGVERWLIDGQLREIPGVTVRDRFHSVTLACVGYILHEWNESQAIRGEVLMGEVGFRLAIDPDTTVGIDVAYIAPDSKAREDAATQLVSGSPTLAVEILSPGDTNEKTYEKVQKYFDHSVEAVWIVEPQLETVRVLRPGKPPTHFNNEETLSGDDYLPGFSVPVAKLFG